MKRKKLNHRKTVAVFAFTCMLLTACSMKPCRCYLLTKYGNVVVGETYIDDNTACSELGYSEMNHRDSSYRFCQEVWDTEIADTQDIVRMFWGN